MCRRGKCSVCEGRNGRCKWDKHMVCEGRTDGLYEVNRPSVFLPGFQNKKVGELLKINDRMLDFASWISYLCYVPEERGFH